MKYLEVDGPVVTDEDAIDVKSGEERFSGGDRVVRADEELLERVAGDPDAGSGAETPSAFASFANFCGERGERGIRAASMRTGLYGAEPRVVTFGMAGVVNGETYSPLEGGNIEDTR